MNVLITGHRGKVGVRLAERLRESAVVRGYDRLDGDELLDRSRLRAACRDQDLIVHCAGVPYPERPWWRKLQVNVLGLLGLLQVARMEGVPRLIVVGSCHATGIFLNHGRPDYFPIDEQHPRRPCRPYAVSRALAETVCARASARGGPATLCLRAPAICTDADLERRRQRLLRNPPLEGHGKWDYGAFVHVDDLVDAICRAAVLDFKGHRRLWICADEIASDQLDALSWARRHHPRVPIRDTAYFEADPARAMIDCRQAQQLLGWNPRRRWRVDAGR